MPSSEVETGLKTCFGLSPSPQPTKAVFWDVAPACGCCGADPNADDKKTSGIALIAHLGSIRQDLLAFSVHLDRPLQCEVELPQTDFCFDRQQLANEIAALAKSFYFQIATDLPAARKFDRCPAN
jgi:hypothetical protein